MGQTILIIDDEIEIASAIQEYLNEQSYKAIICSSVEDAFEIIKKNEIHLILSDIKMNGKSGLDLFHDYKKNIDLENKTPFVLMTGYADIISVQNAFAIGVDELISKPFDLEAIRLVIDYLLDSKRSHGTDHDKYFSIPIEDFMLSKSSDYTVFLLVDDKHVRVTKSGQDFTSQRLENFARKGVTHIYLNSADFAKYTDLQFAIASVITTRPLDITRKTKIMNHLMSSVSQNSVLNKLDKNFLDKSVSAFEAYTSVVCNNPQVANMIDYLILENPDLAQQSTMKAILSSAVATSWKWNSPKVQSRIILAALLSDIGLKDLKSILSKKRFEYTPDERKAYEQHPVLSYQMLSQISNIPDEILFVALQHHENSAGLGFPQKLPRSKTHAYSKLIHAVGEFLETLLQQDDPTHIQQALEHIHQAQGRIVSEQVLKTLYLVFRLELPRQLEGLLLPTETTRVA